MNDSYKEYIVDHQMRVALFRGHIINYVTLIENEIENFIASYFIKDENEILFFKSLFLAGEDYTFSNKIKIFEKIISEKFKDKCDKNLINEINNKRKLRNKVAHFNIRTIQNNVKSDSLYFSTFESGQIKFVEYTYSDANNLVNNTFDILEKTKNYIINLKK